MVLQASRDHQIDLSHSFLVGDKEVDVECAHNAAVRAIRVRTGTQRDVTGSRADWVADNLPAAVSIILNAKS
jgi:D-glycero-D-manno-heptose 1,7-bisphosphate phosphatase